MSRARELIEAAAQGETISSLLEVDRSVITRLIQTVTTAVAEYKSVSRFTTFSRWYKGEHGRAYQTLKRSYSDLAKALRGSTDPADQELAAAVKDAYDDVASKSGEGFGFDDAAKKWTASVG